MGKSAKGLLLLKKDDEAKEIDFELNYLLSLTVEERFRLIHKKSCEILTLLSQYEHRYPKGIYKQISLIDRRF